MLGLVITFALLAVVAGVLGFTTIAVGFAAIAKILFYVFVILFIASLVMHLLRDNTPHNPHGRV